MAPTLTAPKKPKKIILIVLGTIVIIIAGLMLTGWLRVSFKRGFSIALGNPPQKLSATPYSSSTGGWSMQYPEGWLTNGTDQNIYFVQSLVVGRDPQVESEVAMLGVGVSVIPATAEEFKYELEKSIQSQGQINNGQTKLVKNELWTDKQDGRVRIDFEWIRPDSANVPIHEYRHVIYGATAEDTSAVLSAAVADNSWNKFKATFEAAMATFKPTP